MKELYEKNWNALIIGVGECGCKLALDLLNSLAYAGPATAKFYRCYSLIDLIEVDSYLRKGIMFNFKYEDPKFYNYQLTLEEVTRGAGGNWFKSKEIFSDEKQAEEIFKVTQIIERIKDPFHWFTVIFHSTGGGTGSGVGPELAKALVKLEPTHLVLPFIVLPSRRSETKQDIILNSFACVARYMSSDLKAFLVADNTLFDEEFKSEIFRQELNKNIVSVIRGFMTSALQFAFYSKRGYSVPKVYEISDFVNDIPHLGADDFAKPIVPCISEWNTDILEIVSLKALIAITIQRFRLADFLHSPPPSSVLIFVTVPESQYLDIIKTINIKEIKDYIAYYVFANEDLREKIKIILTGFGDLNESISILVLIINPVLEVYEEYKNIINYFEHDTKDHRRSKEYLKEAYKDKLKELGLNKIVEEFNKIISSVRRFDWVKKQVQGDLEDKKYRCRLSRLEEVARVKKSQYANFTIEFGALSCTIVVQEEDSLHTIGDVLDRALKLFFPTGVTEELGIQLVIKEAIEKGEQTKGIIITRSHSCSSYIGKSIWIKCQLES
jgi:hypothetical protein